MCSNNIDLLPAGEKNIVNKMSLDYECVRITNWKECKGIIDSIDEIEKKE